MTSQELSEMMLIKYNDLKKDGDSNTAKELKSLWNELVDTKHINPAEIDTWVKSKGSQLAKFGLDANEKINEILLKSDKEIYGKIPELQDKEYLDKLDKFSIAKLRSDARKNGFPSVQDYIQTAYKFKADREFMKSFEPDPKAGKLEKAQDWITKNFYPNAYEAIKNQPVYGTSSDNKIRNALIADQILNAAAVVTAPIGGLFKQLLLGGGNALASEVAGKYLSNKDIDPLQVGMGAGLGAFGGRVAGKSGGDIIKGTAARLGLKPNSDNTGKVIYGIGNVLESAAIDPKEEVALARKASKKWLGPNIKDPKIHDLSERELLSENTLFQEQIKNKLSGVLADKKLQKDYWKKSLKNEFPTPENIKIHKDIVKYSDPEFNAFKSDLPLFELDQPIAALEGQTGIPFRKAWAEPKFSSSLRTMLKSGSQLGARNSREMDEDDIDSIYNAILENKPEDVKKYNSGLDNNLTPYEKDIIQKFYIRK